MDNFHNLLSRSVDQYQALLDLARELPGVLDSGRPEQIEAHGKRLETAQKALEATEQELEGLWADPPSDIASSALFQKRLSLMRELRDQNDLLLPRIQGTMSVIAAELSPIKENRTAMAGYKSDSKKTGNLVSRTC